MEYVIAVVLIGVLLIILSQSLKIDHGTQRRSIGLRMMSVSAS